ncbi:MAG: beta-ketoacyl-[acyl-carrier-protein] synthase family protein [Hyphomicrobiaceae bacterium]|nr:beta-ketoacyl-[acyl-carrier-protein] synthase family protein [Hyphomicrobiaceae bacterium]
MDVAITGVGVITSIGTGLDAFHSALAANRAKADLTPWAGEPGFENVWVSWVDDFEPERWMPPQVADGTDRFAQLGLAAAVQAVEHAGVAAPDPLRTAIVMGTAFAGLETIARSQHALDTLGPEGVPRKFQIKAWPNMAAAQIALRWRMHGPLLTVSTACASSLDAIGIAAEMIAAGRADYAIAGGSDAACERVQVLSALSYRLTKPHPDPAFAACRPFDADRGSVMPGEGAGAVFLERLDLARARGARIWGRIRGYASLSDASHVTSPDPAADWQIRTMQMAIAQAGLGPAGEGIDAVVAHGTGTRLGDAAEMRAIDGVFGARAPSLRVTSIKGHIGHTAGAAGVLSLAAGLASMANDALVPTAQTRRVDSEARFRLVLERPAPGPIGFLQVNAFGFGGQNASLVVARDGESAGVRRHPAIGG